MKVDLRVAKVLTAEKVPNSKKLVNRYPGAARLAVDR